jgi:hypothetical protein
MEVFALALFVPAEMERVAPNYAISILNIEP